jgi:hypothetical protein
MKRCLSQCEVLIFWQAVNAASRQNKICRSTLLNWALSTTSVLHLHTSELSHSQLKDLKANTERLWNDIHHLA